MGKFKKKVKRQLEQKIDTYDYIVSLLNTNEKPKKQKGLCKNLIEIKAQIAVLRHLLNNKKYE